ncbi:MAG: hypothetical protein ACI4J2_11380 [Ruminococcus sp.]
MSIKEKFSRKKKNIYEDITQTDTNEIKNKTPEEIGFFIIEKAINSKGVKVDRVKFLTERLSGKISPEDLKNAIEYGTASAQIPLDIIRKEAKQCIESTKKISTGESVITGLPGGIVGITAGILADLVQFYANLIILIQKLVYLYGMMDIDSYGDIKEKNKNMANVILVFIGAASGMNGCGKIINLLIKAMGSKYASQSAKLILFAKPAFYSVAKKIAKSIGVGISKKAFAKTAAKVAPVIGGALSGILNYITFSPMANRLNMVLEEEYTKPLNPDWIKEFEKETSENPIC